MSPKTTQRSYVEESDDFRGTFVAGCEALIAARNTQADIERASTHNGYRRRGLARAAIQEYLFAGATWASGAPASRAIARKR